MTANRQWLIAERPLGRELRETDFKANEAGIRAPEAGEITVKTLYLGFDPAQKGWMENIGGYVAPTEIGDVMRGSGIGQVVESQSDKLQKGDIVVGQLGWEEFPTLKADEVNKIVKDDLMTAYLGALGTTGMTAYFGLLKHGQPKPGDVVVVSGAAGATGSMVGQIAKIAGCRTIGIAGGKDKCAWLVDELGFDAAVDYKAEDVRGRLKDLCNQSIDVFYDNVGGAILNHALAHIAMNARVVICGGISRYESGGLPAGPENYFNLIFKRATMSGFIVLDYMPEYPRAQARMKDWIRSGKITYKEDIQEGFDNAPTTLMRLFSGKNFGKQLLKVAEAD